MPKGKNSNLGAAKQQWTAEYEAGMASEDTRRNRSGIVVKPIYDPDDWSSDKYMDDLGFPGQAPWARGIYPTMHRGRSWSQRQLIGLATPEEYNARMRKIIDAGATALSIIPCNSVYRGFDIDEIDPVTRLMIWISLLMTCRSTRPRSRSMTRHRSLCWRFYSSLLNGATSLGIR